MQIQEALKLGIWAQDTAIAENPDYLTRQLITYIGNKRALLGEISNAVVRIKRRLGKQKLACFDVFSGSGVVSRYLKAHSSRLISNDLEDYARVIGRCFLANRSSVDMFLLEDIVKDLNARVLDAPFPKGFIEEMYAPRDELNITKEDRVFYTQNNARRLDNYRRLINEIPEYLHDFLLAPLLSEASIHANTAGVFKGFYKNRITRVGQFGGSGRDALRRIMGEIILETPVLSNFECEVEVLQEDANKAVRSIRGLDLAYLDPPYNQHPYGSNYFMLNLIVHYKRPVHVSKVSGIPINWRRSRYNVKEEAPKVFTDLVEHLDAAFLLVSFNDEGFISPTEMFKILGAFGKVETIHIRYNAFRGSRSFANRSLHTTEHLYIVERR
ncbi:DNA adenine methylase [Fontisphaera persica]|uniref:DNA adenine methylase n=1 Tax=Fontisphaera persica TaxID=2974023 RepID=UPI0024BF42A8|nr:DNA adenine methylase [Fontisphaera persica]WCJ58805.1 DNA adenine methylase [Fontisphaera persica]